MAIPGRIGWTVIGAAACVVSVATMADTLHGDSGAQATRDAQLADLEVVREQYLPSEMAYAPAARRLAEAQLDRLALQAGHLSKAQFQVGLAIVGALTDNTHSGLRLWKPAARATHRLPVRLLWLSDDLIVARAFGDHAELAGASVLKIEGRSPDATYEASKLLLGGSEPARKHWLNSWLESAGILHALGLAASPNEVNFRLRLGNGEVVDRALPMVPVSSMQPLADSARLWSPVMMKNEYGWTPALDEKDLPLYLQQPDLPFRVRHDATTGILYIQFRSNEDDGDHSIGRFLEQLGAEIEEKRPAALVVDHRFNVGGNLLTTLPFMRELPARVDGPIFLLVGRYTFSAGIISAAALKRAGGERVTVIGDELGDRLHFWSEGRAIELPESRYSFRFTDGQFNLVHGCVGEPGCMDDLHDIGVNGVSLEPEIHAPLTLEAYMNGDDRAMAAVHQLIGPATYRSAQRP